MLFDYNHLLQSRCVNVIIIITVIMYLIKKPEKSMYYIVFDLEWNQGSYRDNKKMYGMQLMNFEIIEIAAVKLNESLDIIDRFQRVIKPMVYEELHPIIKDITGFTQEELRKGVPFVDGVKEFLEWCGQDYIFCSWATQDLKELQMNMLFYGITLVDRPPLFYYDVQKLFSYACENGDDRRSLKYAVDFLKLEEDIPFHRAYGDAYYTAKVMQNIDFEKVKNKISIDTFVIPKNKSEEVSLSFDTYSKFISRGYRNKEELMSQKYITTVKCHVCGNIVKRKIGWFSDGMKNYYFAGICKKHGRIKGKIRLRKSVDRKVYAIKTIKVASDAEYDEIVQKKKQIKLKRKKQS